jgi:hypothetical protein
MRLGKDPNCQNTLAPTIPARADATAISWQIPVCGEDRVENIGDVRKGCHVRPSQTLRSRLLLRESHRGSRMTALIA